ncbi:hypothetical protein P3X46_030908 [Hevea brasiliensis]|uniref:galactinol--sucrose galactosyltransferase n=1 Tax=Hevea brasiliensis TaxID=3981 RepID=A0ABQ9KLM2_HEVBR|nr:probable galactinol--sucrose galactosyltransferase 2 [Hevea brasiliensis]KAJ9140236.1 hypothetical protein P3X46_030908 [Hevea brasiliensis]
MTITAAPGIKDGCLMVRDKVLLAQVPENVVISAATCDSAFVGATSSTPSSRHVFSLGVLERYRFLCLFRAKIWWMIPRVGKSGSEIPMETQMLLLEATENPALHDELSSETSTGDTFYILLLPALDGQFRTSLQGTSANELQFCIESGDANVQTSQAFEAVFINSGDNPFELIKNSIKILEKHKGTFGRIQNKKIPAHLDWFGWCTWDAFYSKVNPQGIKDGLQRFLEGGCSPKFLIIDDGWQETVNEFCKEGEAPIEGTQFAARLVDIKENSKFKSSGSDDICTDLREFIDKIKEKYGLKFVYVWHALAGYWGGVMPSSETMKKYNPKLVYPIQSPGNIGNQRDIAMDSMEKYGVGIIDPCKIFDFYNDLHSYLVSSNIDGVKVDVQNLIETLGTGYGGRVTLTRKYQEALEQSIARNFKGNNLICCMSHNSDSIYSSRKSAVARASEDFMPRESTFQTLHIASVAFNSLLLGEIVVPDWDMFHSKHKTAEFHGAARAVGGCAVYVSDKPGNHDFKLLKKLVLPDGSILRARHAGRPTRDCLFVDPVTDGKSLLKIWNLNKLSGVIGIFNCQGAGSWPMKQAAEEMPNVPFTPLTLSGNVRPTDVEFLREVAGEDWNEESAVYAFNSGSLSVLPKNGSLEVCLATLEGEIYTISPIRVFGQDIHFAPIGLLDMYNSGGAVEAVNCRITDSSECRIKIKGRGCGRFGAYSSTKPKHCMVENREEDFTYSAVDGLLAIKLQGKCNLREIEFVY